MTRPAHLDRFTPAGNDDPPFLLNPGPINVSKRVAEALLRGDMCHREPDYFEVQDRIRARLLEAFAPSGDYTSILITGSGTAALEASVSSIVGPGEKLLVLENGVYGNRIRQIAEAHGIEHTVLEQTWYEANDPKALEQALAADPSIKVVAGVHHETTTGLLNPVKELAAVAHAAGRVFMMDTISGIGGEELDLEGWGIDLVCGTANKCIRGLPGMAFVLLKRELMTKLEAYPPRTLYLHLPTYHQKQENQGTPFTPGIQAAYAFDEALAELLEEGVANRVQHAAAMSTLLRDGFAKLGLELLLPAELRSNTITTIDLPEGFTYETLHDELRKENFVIYAGQGDLRKRCFRVSNMGAMSAEDYERFLSALARVLGK